MKKQIHKLNIRYRDDVQADESGKGYVLTFSTLIALMVAFMAWSILAFIH